MTDASAVVLVDKPEGPSSHDVVAAARRALGTRRVGHTGTLDPFATGLLILCVGAATRLVEYFHLLPKTYRAEVVFGEARDTDDRTGRVTGRGAVGPDLAGPRGGSLIEQALERAGGHSEQRPPDYSARRQGGRRAYEAARQGEPLALEPRPVEVYEARLLDWTPPRARIRYTVSTGTYIRSLARDLGASLGCPAHLGALRRTSIGPFDVGDADPVDAIAWDRPATLDPLSALAWLPARELADAERTAVGYGQPLDGEQAASPTVDAGRLSLAPSELPVALHADGRLVAIGRRDEGRTRPTKVFDAA